MTMKAQKLIRLSCILFSLCGLFSASLFADNQSSTQDRLAISEMLAQYSYRWDSKDSMGFAGLFTTDAVMERWQEGMLVENSRVIGKEAIYQYAKRSHEGRLADRQTRHHFSGLVFLELTSQTAVTENMALITHQTAESQAAFITSSGIYRNSWQKTADGWRISKRLLFTDSFGGN